MTAQAALYVMEDLWAPELLLHVRPGAGAFCAVVGWDVVPEPVDGGPPPILQEVFAAALVRCGTLACLAVASRRVARRGWFSEDGDRWLRVPPTLLDWLRQRPPLWILATDSPEHARTLFDGTVSWGNQHQVGFVLRTGAFPILPRRLVVDVLNARDTTIAELNLPEEVIALVLPAVDGDFVEIVAREPGTRGALHAAIAAECSQRGVSFGVRDALPFSLQH